MRVNMFFLQEMILVSICALCQYMCACAFMQLADLGAKLAFYGHYNNWKDDDFNIKKVFEKMPHISHDFWWCFYFLYLKWIGAPFALWVALSDRSESLLLPVKWPIPKTNCRSIQNRCWSSSDGICDIDYPFTASVCLLPKENSWYICVI